MTPEDFNAQMQRLERAYIKGFYNEERVKTIWQEVKDIPSVSFSNIVSKFISTLRQPPLAESFRDEVIRVREANNKALKLSHSASTRDFWEGSNLTDPDRAEALMMIKAKLHGEISQETYDQFWDDWNTRVLKKSIVK